MTIADFHFHVTQVKRSGGASVMEYAAYRACEKLKSTYYNETYDYSSKPGLIISEILTPDYVPEKYKDRKTLWDAVEENEKRNDAQLAFNFDFSLMNEFTIEENIEIARRFIQENFVSRGMICDWAFHFPSQGDAIENPHIHMLCPIRPMKTDGTWENKQVKELLFNDDGTPLLDENGKQKFNAIKTTDWSDVETLTEWRKAWADINNKKFEEKGLPQRISAESYEAQGLNLFPTIHEGPAVRAMEAKGIRTEKGDFNRAIRKANEIIKKVHSIISELYEWIKDTKKRKIKFPVLTNVERYYDAKINYYHGDIKTEINKEYIDVLNYIRQNNITTFEGYAEHFEPIKAEYDDLEAKRKALKAEITELNNKVQNYDRYLECKPIYEAYTRKKFDHYRKIFYNENETMMKRYYAITKKYPEFLDADFSKKTITGQLAKKQKEIEEYEIKLNPIMEKISIMKKIKTANDTVAGTNPNARLIEVGGREIYVKSANLETEKKKPSLMERLEVAKEQVKENDKQKEPTPKKNSRESER